MRVILKLFGGIIMYNTKQKQILIDYFIKNSDKHYSIKEITDAVSDYKIGKSTVYRLIDKMTKDGSVRRFNGNDGKSVLYQYIGNNHGCDKHFHLKCTKCGLLIHLECEYMNRFNKHIEADHKFEIDNSKTLIYGICSNCNERCV